MPTATPFLSALAFALLAFPARAELAEITTSPGITLEQVGIFCSLEGIARADAPETDLGYVELLSGEPQLVFEQREVPARLGISFGVLAISDRDIDVVRIETYKPGDSQPEIWYTSYIAGNPHLRAFRFDFDRELITGLWLLEAYEDDQQLYSVQFQVVPGTELAGISSDCNLLS